MKICFKCKKEKSLDEFYNNKQSKDGCTSRCKECLDEYTKQPEIRARRRLISNKWRKENYQKDLESKRKWNKDHPEWIKNYRATHQKERDEYLEKNKDKIKARHQEYWYQKKYGITLQDKINLLQEQGNVCAICKIPIFNVHGAHLDHDHKTGKVRGILCKQCNNALGGFQDNIEILESAIKYLNR